MTRAAQIPATSKGESASTPSRRGGEGGQASFADVEPFTCGSEHSKDEEQDEEQAASRIPFGGRLPAGAFLFAAALVGVFLVVLVVTPLNR